MKDKATYPIELDRAMYAFLEEMAKKYNLPDVGKALRCLVNYAREQPNQQKTIFADIRCIDC